MVGVEQLGLGGEGLLEQPPHDLHVDVQQRRQRPDVADVLHEDAHARPLEVVDGHPGQRDAQEVDVFAVEVAGQGPAGIVHDPAAGGDLLDVALVGGRVHRDYQVEAGGARRVAAGVGADFVPGRQPLNVRGEEVLPRHRDPHAEDRAPEQSVGARRTGSVDGADLEGKIVDARARGREAAVCGDSAVDRHQPAPAPVGSGAPASSMIDMPGCSSPAASPA